MKKIIIMCAVLGFAWSGAEAQTQCTRINKAKVKKVAHSKAKTTVGSPLQICHEENGYYTCCTYNKSVAKAH